jgi:hypothetical protein
MQIGEEIMKRTLGMLLVTLLLCAEMFSQSQQTGATNANPIVPTLVKFSGSLTDIDGKPLSGTVGVTFLLYKDEQGGAPLWMETQNVAPDKGGHYTAVLGSTTSQGLPTDLFASGEARWLGVQAEGQAEQPRVLLLSVPYALKAGDAETVGGLPASAFLLAAPPVSGSLAANSQAASQGGSVSPLTATDVTTTGGTANYLPIFSGAATIVDSSVFQTGTGTTAKVGINTTTPATALDVKGGATVRGTLSLPATGVATATKGTNSQPQDFMASSFSSTTSTALNQTFQLQAEPAGNDTTTPSGTLNLLYGLGATAPAETGLKISNKGLITFATGQTFPGTGSGTVKSVASGAGLTGGPITTTGTLSIANAGVTNTMLAHPSLTITPGTALTGGGVVALGGTTTLNVDTTKIPQLVANNTFIGNEKVSGSMTAASFVGNGAGLTNVNAAELGGVAPGLYARLDLSDGFAGDVDAAGSFVVDTAETNSGGIFPGLVFPNGSTFSSITSTQSSAGNLHGLDFWTGGADRMVIAELGNVGIGTLNPYTKLHLVQSNSGGLGPSITLMNSGGGAGSGASVDFDGYDTTTNSPTARIQSIDDGNSSSSLTFLIKNPGAASNPLTEQVRISDYGSLLVDSSGLNALKFGSGTAGGQALVFGGTSSGEGIASCRSDATTCSWVTPSNLVAAFSQYGLDFYTGYTKQMTIQNNGIVIVAQCTIWGNTNQQGSCPSDARLKTNIQPFSHVLDRLVQLEPVHFNWNPSNPPLYRFGSGRNTGLIAQQVEKVFPDMVTIDEYGYRRVNYGLLPYLLLEGVRELKAANDSLRSEADNQRKQNEQARAEIAKLRRAAAATNATVANLGRTSAAKDAQIAVMSLEIEQLRKEQQQMAVLLARFVPPQGEHGKSQTAAARPAVESPAARVSEVAHARF